MPDAANGRASAAAAQPRANRVTASFEQALARYRDLTMDALFEGIPEGGPQYLYNLVADYPRRPGKGLRAALCLATCAALGGSQKRALDMAVAAELFHNAFLIHDDVQDESLSRRGGPTLHRAYGNSIAINVGNATNLLALQYVINCRRGLGPKASWVIAQETERMMRLSLEGQAIELGWIKDNECRLAPSDYLQMCLKKTSWYSFVYPMQIGAVVAEGASPARYRFGRFGWYIGAAFQIQDDILNLTGEFAAYGKERAGDLAEGKRTLMLIHLLNACGARERQKLVRLLGKRRTARTAPELAWIYERMLVHGSVEFARKAARQFAGAALLEGLSALREVPPSPHRQFILEMPLYVVSRDR